VVVVSLAKCFSLPLLDLPLNCFLTSS